MYLASVLSATSLLLLPLSTHASGPLELFKRNQKTCTPTPTTYVTTLTITTSSQPYCPTVTSTKPNIYLCTRPTTTCGPHPECIVEKYVTVPCPAKCCPKHTPTTTVQASCTTTTCQTGCATQTQYVTATCDRNTDPTDAASK